MSLTLNKAIVTNCQKELIWLLVSLRIYIKKNQKNILKIIGKIFMSYE